MSKYSYEFKLKVIKYYLEEHYSYNGDFKKNVIEFMRKVHKICTLKDVVEQEK